MGPHWNIKRALIDLTWNNKRNLHYSIHNYNFRKIADADTKTPNHLPESWLAGVGIFNIFMNNICLQTNYTQFSSYYANGYQCQMMCWFHLALWSVFLKHLQHCLHSNTVRIFRNYLLRMTIGEDGVCGMSKPLKSISKWALKCLWVTPNSMQLKWIT